MLMLLLPLLLLRLLLLVQTTIVACNLCYLNGSDSERFRRLHRVAVRRACGNAKHGLTLHLPHDELRCGLGACCKSARGGGVKATDGAPGCVSSSRYGQRAR